MKLEGLLNQLEQLRAQAEIENFEGDLVSTSIIKLLVDYIGNPKVEEAINEIPF
jgi:hypothetical protein